MTYNTLQNIRKNREIASDKSSFAIKVCGKIVMCALTIERARKFSKLYSNPEIVKL